MPTDTVTSGARHPETYYAKWEQLYDREQRLLREMNAAPADAAKCAAWHRATERLSAHTRAF